MGWVRWNASSHSTEGHTEACGGWGRLAQSHPTSEWYPRIVSACAYMHTHTHSLIRSARASPVSTVSQAPCEGRGSTGEEGNGGVSAGLGRSWAGGTDLNRLV